MVTRQRQLSMTCENQTEKNQDNGKTRAWVKRTPEEIEELKKKIEEKKAEIEAKKQAEK